MVNGFPDGSPSHRPEAAENAEESDAGGQSKICRKRGYEQYGRTQGSPLSSRPQEEEDGSSAFCLGRTKKYRRKPPTVQRWVCPGARGCAALFLMAIIYRMYPRRQPVISSGGGVFLLRSTKPSFSSRVSFLMAASRRRAADQLSSSSW